MHAFATSYEAVDRHTATPPHRHIATGNFAQAGELFRQMLATDPQRSALADAGLVNVRWGKDSCAG